MAEPPGSADALADQTGSTYQRADAANGLSARPPVVEVEELLDELLLEEELLELEELLLEDELLELLDELEELLLEDELEELELLEVAPELLLDEDEELLELEVLEEPLIVPFAAVRITRSSLAPSSRLEMRNV
jgi:hypothetical protein